MTKIYINAIKWNALLNYRQIVARVVIGHLRYIGTLGPLIYNSLIVPGALNILQIRINYDMNSKSLLTVFKTKI